MPVPFKIKVTKDILELSKECGINDDVTTIGKNCAIAFTLKDIFPNVFVSGNDIYPFGIDDKNPSRTVTIPLPKIARDFVKVFDSLSAIHNLRMRLPEFEFSIDIPDEIISEIDIDEITRLTNRACLLRRGAGCDKPVDQFGRSDSTCYFLLTKTDLITS